MDSHPLVYVDTSTIREGKLEALKVAMDTLAAFVKAHMPRLISYGFFLDERREHMTVIAVHPDSESLEVHMDEGREEFRKFSDLIVLSRIEVYGRVSDAVLERLHQKADMLGAKTVVVHEFATGFAR
jgi:hypothetical protein